MHTTTEREDAVQQPSVHGDNLAGRPDAARPTSPTPEQVESWLNRARGAAVPGVTTEAVLSLTRGDD